MNRLVITLVSLALVMSTFAHAQRLSLADAIRQAQEHSLAATVAKLNFMSHYWSYRSFKAELLPAVNFYGSLMQYNHSTVEARDPQSGRIFMVDNNTLSNNLTLSIDQNIAALGGKLSVQSYLYRLDQFNDNSKIYNTQPARVQYVQPLFAFNNLKWRKKTEPLKYDNARRLYLEAMEEVATQVVTLFFNVLSAQSAYQQSLAMVDDREQLFEQAKKRLDLGTTTKADVLQLELSLINAQVDVKEKVIGLQNVMFRLRSYLGLPLLANVELMPPTDIPAFMLQEDDVVQRAIDNSPFAHSQRLELLEAEKAVKQAKAARGLKVTANAELGFNRNAVHFRDAFTGLQNNQIVGLTFSMPVFDWGVNRGRVRMAEADLAARKTSQEQEREEYIHDLRTQILKFNMQSDQCAAAQRAEEIAAERYAITRRLFETGSVSVTELNTAWQESEAARAAYIVQLYNFWNGYYSLRKVTLYDFMTHSDISVDYERIINE